MGPGHGHGQDDDDFAVVTLEVDVSETGAVHTGEVASVLPVFA